jgi:hypothetical protein
VNALWQELELVLSRRGLPERLIYAVADAAIGYRVRNASYRNLAELNDVMASRDLKAAVDARLLVPDGERRGRVYVGASEIRALFDKLRTEHIRSVPDPFVAQTPLLFGVNPS